jgi:hypothetical protein
MPRKSHRRKSHRRHRGGSVAPNPSSYSSATTYGGVVNGSVDSQFNRVFGSGGNSNILTGAQGQNSGVSPMVAQKAGRRHNSRRNKRGGFFGQVINQAIVPFGILGLQQTYGRKSHHSGRKTHRRRRH